MVTQVATEHGRWIVNKLHSNTFRYKLVAWIPFDSLIFIALSF